MFLHDNPGPGSFVNGRFQGRIIDIFGKYVNKIKQRVLKGSRKRTKTKPMISVKKEKKLKRAMSPKKKSITKYKDYDRRMSNDFQNPTTHFESTEVISGFDTD